MTAADYVEISTKFRAIQEEVEEEDTRDSLPGISQITGKGKEPMMAKCEGFSRGLKPERILGATNEPAGEIMFLVKWRDCEDTDLVTAKEANLKIPETVIKFYEEHIEFGEDYVYDPNEFNKENVC